MTKEEMIEKTDSIIHELVYPKWELLKAYNYYNGIRDKNLFRYLEERFGTSVPTTIEFTPLLKKHVDAIIGEYLGSPIIPKILCKDSETIINIDREKQLKIAQEQHNYLKSHLKNSIIQLINGKNSTDTLIEKALKQIVEEVEETFESQYEIAALNVIEWIILSRETDILTKLRDLLLDLLCSGYSYYRVKPSVNKDNIRLEVHNPMNVFTDRNIESPYIKHSTRCVIRHWMYKELILNTYGKELSKKDIEILEDRWESIYNTAMLYVKVSNKSGLHNGLWSDVEVTPGYPDLKYNKFSELIPVYEVEWLETDKDFVMLRYETIRIGDEIYILRGKNKDVIRSKSNPNCCTLSLNGVYFLNRSTEPYSLILACASLLDRYDILHFYRDNIIANSGSIGDWVDETLIPSHLGVSFDERLVKWIALKKQGIALINSSEEGAERAPNQIFQGYDDTAKVQAVQAIQLAIDATENTVSSITGVFRERLNGIEARDAVTNVEIGLKNSFIVTKLFNHLMDLLVSEILLDCLNLAKVVFKNGLTGTYILGDKYLKIFTARSEYFTLTDYDVRIITSSDVVRDLELIKTIIPEFVKAGNMPPDIILEALTSKSIPDLKNKVRKAMKKLKEENDQIMLLSQQNELLQLLLQEANKSLQQALLKIQQLTEANSQSEKQTNEMKLKIEWYKAQTDRTFKEKQAEEAKRRTDIEAQLLYDGNPYNDKVNMSAGM